MQDSELDHLIEAEITNDPLWKAIRREAAAPGVRHILEIGSSSGEGSTAAFVAGMRESRGDPQIHCFEISAPRLEALRSRYREDEHVHCHGRSTVSLERFPSPDDLSAFHRRYHRGLNLPALATLLQWRQQDIDYIARHSLSANGIRQLRAELHIEHFDLVLIDGSEFTGRAELEDVYGAPCLLLDDILAFKNHENFLRLLDDPSYELIEASASLRNGYACFRKG